MKQLIPFLLLSLLAGSCSKNDSNADAYGNFEATEIMVASQASGPLVIFNIEEGQTVKAGEQVGFVDTLPLNLKKQQLLAQREAITAKHPGVTAQIAVLNQQKKNAQIDKDRIQNMFNEGAATQKQLDDVNGQLDLFSKQVQSVETQNAGIAAELKSIDIQVAQVNDQINRSYIINPADGTVLSKYAEQSEITAPGKNLYKIGDLSKIELRAYISGNQLATVKIGQQVRILYDTENGDMGETKGTITWISSSAEFTPKIVQTKEERTNLVYALKVEVPNTDGRLKIGMPGEMMIQ